MAISKELMDQAVRMLQAVASPARVSSVTGIPIREVLGIRRELERHPSGLHAEEQELRRVQRLAPYEVARKLRVSRWKSTPELEEAKAKAEAGLGFMLQGLYGPYVIQYFVPKKQR